MTLSRFAALGLVGLLAVTSACATAEGRSAHVGVAGAVASSPPTLPPTSAPAGTPHPTAAGRRVSEQLWTPFAHVGGVTLTLPSSRVEWIGFHESNHDGARRLTSVGVVPAADLESRRRDTGSRTAADVVADPNVEIRSPVTGTVKRAGSYVLYCKLSDDFVVIKPDAHPGWEVKVLHIDGLRVSRGQRVIAAETVLAPRPRKLPFESQVDELSTTTPWPHVHIEVVDPSIPDRPTPGGGCT